MAKKAAYGTRLHYTDPTSALNARVHYVADISGPEIGVETIDVTTHDSPDNFAQFIPGMADGGDVTFDLIFDPDTDGHARILELAELRRVINFALYAPRPDHQFITDPDFLTGTGWALSGPTITGGGIQYAGTGTGYFTAALTGLVPGEEYLLRIVFRSAGAGTLTAEYQGQVYPGAFNCANAGTQDLRFTVNEEQDGNLVIAAPGVVNTGYVIESVHLYGMTDLSSRFEFAGVFTKAGTMFPVKDAMKASVGIKVSGKPTFTI